MSRVVNIAGLEPVDDPEYRYKMPLVFGKVEGRGNGIKTVIPNITDVAMSLHRSPAEVNKFFGCELGAQTTYSAETDRAVVNGAHTDAVLQQMMRRYIQGFVLCPSCNYPETDYKIKNEIIFHKCAACGAKDMVEMTHKLCTFILAQEKKNKKEQKAKDKKKKEKKGGSDDEKAKKKEKKAKKKENGENGKKEKKDKKKKDKKEKKKKKHSDADDSPCEENGGVHHSKDEDEDEVVATLDDLSIGDGEVKLLAIKAVNKYLATNPDASPDDVTEVVVNEQMASALTTHEKIHIFVRAAFTHNFYKEKQIEKHAQTILKLTSGNEIMERHLISALELFAMSKPKSFPVLIKQLYDEDALQENVILEWAGEGRSDYTLSEVDEESRAKLRGEMEPVVVWLQDEDSDEDSD